MPSVRVYRTEVLGATTAGSPQVRVYRTEVLGAAGTGGGAQVRVFRTEVLGAGTTGVLPQVRVYRTEVLGSRGTITYYDDASQSWPEAIALWEYDTTTVAWVQIR